MNEPTVLLHMRELLSYLGRRQVVTVLTLTQTGLLRAGMGAPIDLSYLADNIFLLRFFEFNGAIRKAISVVKSRSGRHESTIREFVLRPNGIDVSEPLADFSGVLTGTPIYTAPPESEEER